MKITKVESRQHWGKGVICQCNHPDPLICHEREESTGVCSCKCHEGFKGRDVPERDAETRQ